MQKIKYVFILIMILLFPSNIKAIDASIKSISIDGNDTVTVSSEFSEGFRVEFSNIKKGTSDTLGLWIVAFELEYDENIFVAESISSDGNVWASTIYKENNKTYVLSQFNKDPYHDACVDNVLYCGGYIVAIKFYVKNTDKTTSVIKMKNVGAGVFKVSGNMNPEYNTADMIELEYPSELSKTINIEKPENVEVQVPKSIISSKPAIKKPVTTTKVVNNNQKVETQKSDNNYLKSLKISGYPIEFSKDKKTYDIIIPTDIDSVKIQAIAESDKAIVEVIGNDKIDASNGQVIINVKAENGNTNTYTVNIEKKDIVENEKNGFKFGKKEMIIGEIILGSIILIFLIIRLIIFLHDRKIDKAIDSM